MAERLPATKRARIEVLNIYEISDSDLVLLERGSPDSLLLNFAIFSLSAAVSFLIALPTTDIPSVRLFIVIVVVCAVGFVAGFVLLSMWLWYRRSRATIFSEIRRRMPPDGIPVLDAEASERPS